MVNKVFLIGRLGKDPVIKHFSNDNAIAEFSLATSESYKDKEGKWVENTEWHNIKLPNRFMAERAEKYLKKGSLIHLEGKIKTRNYDDKDGNKKYITEIIVEQYRMLDGKRSTEGGGGENEGGGSTYQAPAAAQNFNNTTSAAPTTTVEDDLPF